MNLLRPAYRIIRSLLIVVILTLITQVGGLVYLIYLPLGWRIRRKYSGLTQITLRVSTFALIYLCICGMVVPPLARTFGRVPLPVSLSSEVELREGSLLLSLANRHYVRPELRDLLEGAGRALKREYPNAQIRYLDAGFPFFDGFPLLPHLSHSDGRKVDLGFLYANAESGELLQMTPTCLGYGWFAGPRSGEHDRPAACKNAGHRFYDFPGWFVFQSKDPPFVLHPEATAGLIRWLSRENAVRKIFLEPHLKARLGLETEKVRYHGCHAVRHDDHIHVEI